MQLSKDELDQVLEGNVLVLGIWREEDKVGEVRVELEKMFEVDL